MKCSLILFATLCLILCALAAGCTSPTQAEIKPVETTTVPTPLPHKFNLRCYGCIDTACC